MPQPELIRHLNTRFHGGAGPGGSDHFEVAGTQEVQARFGGRLFRSLFQPVVARGGELLGHEALLQVQGPGGEGVSPRTIFELASDEEALALDHMACTLHVLNFARQGHGQRGLLALNLSPRALLAFAGGQEALFQAVLAACGLSPQRVVLEVTDHGFEDCTALAAAIAQCRGRGYHTAIDNFGRFSCDIERLEALAPDIVHAHYTTSYGYLGARCGRHPLVMTAWGSDLLVTPFATPWMRWLTGWTLRRADLITGDSQSLVDAAHSYHPRAAVHCIHWGVDLARFAPAPWPKTETRRRAPESGATSNPSRSCVPRFFIDIDRPALDPPADELDRHRRRRRPEHVGQARQVLHAGAG